MESWVGPVYFVIFSYWRGPVPYLDLFGGGPVKKNTLYIIQGVSFDWSSPKKF